MKNLKILFFLLFFTNAFSQFEDQIIKDANDSNYTSLERYLLLGGNANAKSDNGDTALMLASFNGAVNIVILLIDYAAELDLKNKNGETALIIASKAGINRVIDILLDNRADLYLKDKKGNDAYYYLELSNNEISKKLFLNKGYKSPIKKNNSLIIDGDNNKPVKTKPVKSVINKPKPKKKEAIGIIHKKSSAFAIGSFNAFNFIVLEVRKSNYGNLIYSEPLYRKMPYFYSGLALSFLSNRVWYTYAFAYGNGFNVSFKMDWWLLWVESQIVDFHMGFGIDFAFNSIYALKINNLNKLHFFGFAADILIPIGIDFNLNRKKTVSLGLETNFIVKNMFFLKRRYKPFYDLSLGAEFNLLFRFFY